MKIINAKFFEEEIKKKFWEIWYEEKYQYYFGGNYRKDFKIIDSENGINRDFAVIGNEGNLIGYIGYTFDSELKIAKWFGAVNFSNEKIQFGMALKQVIYDCFNKFGADLVSFEVIVGNPIEFAYDRLCEKAGGRVVGIKSRRAVNMKGEKCDVKEYEIKKEDFLKKAGEKIDRNKWSNCPCNTAQYACCTCISRTCHKCVASSEYLQGNYCANCGKPLNENAWKELEERVER